MERRFLAIALVAFSAQAFSADSPFAKNGNSRLIGKWTWTRPTNSCTEVYEYRADGTLFVVSGDEKSDNTYHLAYEPSLKGFYKITSTIVKDRGGKDCADSETDDTGATDTNFIKFHPSGNQYTVCHEESFEKCFGPLRRIAE